MKQACEMFQELAAAKGKDLRMEYSTDHGASEFFGDPDRIHQILVNLISNSIKYADPGFILVKVEQKPMGIDSVEVLFSVQDTGTGVDPEDQKQLFKEYFQTAKSGQQGGTGLGLAISKKLVMLMGGTIGYRPALPAGSVFWFSLPLRVATPPVFAIASEEGQQKLDLKSLRVDGKVLVVEDSLLNQKVLWKHLKYFGCTGVDFAGNGEEALNILGRKAYDLIFMDVQMPIKDGLQATLEIRRKGVCTPIVALTAGALQSQKKECFDSGMNDFLSKPVYREEIAKILMKYLPYQLPNKRQICRVEVTG
jgi:CheY-like chemotaxis protein